MPLTYNEVYFPVLLQGLIALLVASGLIGVSALLGNKLKNKVKDSPYECGMAPQGSAKERFSVKFYLVGMLFILFDIEAVFMYPWAVAFHQLGLYGLIEMVLFIAILLVGYLYLLKKQALDWNPSA